MLPPFNQGTQQLDSDTLYRIIGELYLKDQLAVLQYRQQLSLAADEIARLAGELALAKSSTKHKG